jgi:hypothetical protein
MRASGEPKLDGVDGRGCAQCDQSTRANIVPMLSPRCPSAVRAGETVRETNAWRALPLVHQL